MKQYVLLFSTWILMFQYACTNPFTTRADLVEEPDISSGVVYDTPNQPEIVFSNFIKSIEQKNADEYMRCLSSTDSRFRFEPDAGYLQEFISNGWSLVEEQNYFAQLTISSKSDYPKIIFAFTDTISPPVRPIYLPAADDSVETTYDPYLMLITHSPDSTQIVKGYASFKLFHDHDSDNWHIYHWIDKAMDDAPSQCMTALKLYYSKNAGL